MLRLSASIRLMTFSREGATGAGGAGIFACFFLRMRTSAFPWCRLAGSALLASPARGRASFGATVTLRRNDGREQSFRIVGEDEADPSRGSVSYVSPLARAVLTHGPGETVEIAGQEAVILDVR
jgi:Transcription elongation factor, GreA/GreB, C-term